MGFSIRIGNAVPFEEGDDSFVWEVEEVRRDDAPAFGDPSDYINLRSPSYTGWKEFARETGLEDLFFNTEHGLMRSHPGIVSITKEHLAVVEQALERRQQTNGGRPPGFWTLNPENPLQDPIDNGTDGQLARLVWLHYWMKWAIETCDHPAFENH